MDILPEVRRAVTGPATVHGRRRVHAGTDVVKGIALRRAGRRIGAPLVLKRPSRGRPQAALVRVFELLEEEIRLDADCSAVNRLAAIRQVVPALRPRPARRVRRAQLPARSRLLEGRSEKIRRVRVHLGTGASAQALAPLSRSSGMAIELPRTS